MKRLNLLLLFTAVMLLWSLPSWGETINELKSQLEESNSVINSKQKQLNAVKDQKRDISKEIQELDMQIELAQNSLDKLNDQIAKLESDINIKERDIAEAEKKLKEQDELLRERIVALYESGETSYLDILLDSDSIADFFARYQVVEQLLEYDKDLMNSTEANKELIERCKQELEQQQAQIISTRENKLQAKAQLDTYRGNRNVYLRKLNSKIQSIEEAIDQEIRESEEIKEKIRKIQQGSKKQFSGGAFMWPIDGTSRISSYYGYRMHPVLKKKKLHTGLDIAASQGTDIVAANSGTVIFAGWYGGYGKALIIDHGGGKSTLYGHTSKLLVSEGQEVKKGQHVAEVGSTGLSTGPHLHFEVRENGATVDPLNYVSKP